MGRDAAEGWGVRKMRRNEGWGGGGGAGALSLGKGNRDVNVTSPHC